VLETMTATRAHRQGKISGLPNNAWPNLRQTVGQTILSTEYWWWTRTSRVKCSMARLTDQSSVSRTRSAVGESSPSSSPPASSASSSPSSSLSSSSAFLGGRGIGIGAAFFPSSCSLCLTWSHNPLSSASSSSVFSVGPDRSGCFSLRLAGDRSLRRLAAMLPRLGSWDAPGEEKDGKRSN